MPNGWCFGMGASPRHEVQRRFNVSPLKGRYAKHVHYGGFRSTGAYGLQFGLDHLLFSGQSRMYLISIQQHTGPASVTTT